jgi:hypothetical protein
MACIAVVAQAERSLATGRQTAAAGLLEKRLKRDGTELVVRRTLARICMLQGRPSCAGRTTGAGACARNTRSPTFAIMATSKSIRKSTSIGYLAQLWTQAPYPRRLRSKPGSRRRSRPLNVGDLTSSSSSGARRPSPGSPLAAASPTGSLASASKARTEPCPGVRSQGASATASLPRVRPGSVTTPPRCPRCQ